MKFQKKIMGSYILFSVVVTIAFGIFFYTLSIGQYKEKEYESMKTVADVKLQLFESMLQEMERVGTYLLSNQDVLIALNTLSTGNDQDTYEETFFSQAASEIRSELNTYYMMSSFYRVIVFNQNGAVVANNNYAETRLNPNASFFTIPWKDSVQGTKGKDKIIGMHEDDWGSRKKPMVMSVVKEVQGNQMGLIEVQQELSTIDAMMSDAQINMDYILFTKEGDLIYTNNPAIDQNYYQKFLSNKKSLIREIRTPQREKAILYLQESGQQDVVFMAVNYMDIGGMAVAEVLPVTLALLAGFLIFSSTYVYISSKYLTKPIQLLQGFMENTQLDNLHAEIPEKISNDEIESLYISFKDVLSRLNESIVKEKRLSLMQLQAQFDLLQAQVNPHFIYNVLNVISNRGVEDEDEVICDICSDLAGMLRYATNTREKYASVSAEKDYLEQYMRLLKYRYEHRLIYKIDISPEIEHKLLPKIVLQQIVENSIQHGYQNVPDTIEITVTGGMNQKGWFLKIEDNGTGIQKDKVRTILSNFEKIKCKLSNSREHVEVEIGGMGLVNTYARLYLLHNDLLSFLIESGDEKGTRVILQINEK